MAARVWRMFVDESGNFDDPDDTVAVTGLLCPASLPQSSWSGLRRLLEAAWPGMRWPLHAWLTFRPSMLALLSQRLDQGEDGSPEWRDAHAAAQVLQQFAPDKLAAAETALDQGAEPEHGALVALEQCLRARAPALAQALTNAARRRRERIEVIAERAATAASWPDGHVPAALLIASSEEVDGALATAPDRYLELLCALLTRTVALLQEGGSHDVWLHVAGRRVTDPTLGLQRMLHLAHLTQATTRATARTPGVRFVVGGIASYDERVHPGIVLADLASNRARMSLGSVPLAAAEARLGRLGWALRSGANSRTHLVSWGTNGAAALESATALAKPWAREQAAEWQTGHRA